MESEYPTIEVYLDNLDYENEIATLFNEFNIGAYKYSKKYLYGFNIKSVPDMLWTVIEKDYIITRMQHFLKQTMKHYINEDLGNMDQLKELIKKTKKVSKVTSLDSVYRIYSTLITDDEFYEKLNRSASHLLPIKGCKVINLKTGKIRDRSKKDNFTYSCDVEYTTERSETFKNFIKSIMCDSKDNEDYVKKIFGYCLTGDIRARVYFILYGKGSNGKSVLLNLMHAILNEQFQAVSKCVFINCGNGKTGGCEVLQLKDCRMASFSETEANDIMNESLMKMLSGHDPITARGLFKDPVTFIPQCKLMMCTNFKPEFNANDKANVDRVRLVPLNARFCDNPTKPNEYLRINGLEDIIKDKHLNEFFSWCVEGAIEYYKNNIFNPTGEMLDAQNEYIKEQSNISNFVDDMYDVSDLSDMILKSEIKQQYDIWSKENGLKPMKMGILYGALDDKFGKSVKCQTVGPYKSKWVYRGLKVKVEEHVHDLDM
jgi:P4 family phage/plasmid primase-like protien